MSSYLGKTGANVRAVLSHAQEQPCVLLLDEFDAIAKRRDDDSDVGELKRLVTVILQTIDDWQPTSLLVAATNHSDLLDPAVWRRFDVTLQFDLPNHKQRTALDRKSTRLNSSHSQISYAVFCLKKKSMYMAKVLERRYSRWYYRYIA